MKCIDVHKFEKPKNFSINIFELSFYQDESKWIHKLIPIEVGKNESDRVIDLLIYKNYYALIQNVNVFLGDHHKTSICRRCLNSYTSQNMLMLHKQKCENSDITSIRNLNESHIYWRNHFHKNALHF